MNIIPLDLNFQGLRQTIAAYLVSGPDGHLLVETGPQSTLPALRLGLAEQGLTPDDIRHVLVTHIHLDHAGAAGWWATQGTQVYVHHVGAPHLIDPSKLLASAERIYGDETDQLWGGVTPAPADRVTAVYDGETIQMAGLTITALDTPGHARHHLVYLVGDVAFTGDAAGIRLPGSDLVDLPAPPPEFDLVVWLQTLDRLDALDVAILYPTHFGPVTDKAFQLGQLRQRLHESTEFVYERLQAGINRDELVAQYQAWHRQRAADAGLSAEFYRHYEAANPLFMSVDGIARYWRKRTAAAG